MTLLKVGFNLAWPTLDIEESFFLIIEGKLSENVVCFNGKLVQL
jgi:hypothetical protein